MSSNRSFICFLTKMLNLSLDVSPDTPSDPCAAKYPRLPSENLALADDPWQTEWPGPVRMPTIPLATLRSSAAVKRPAVQPHLSPCFGFCESLVQDLVFELVGPGHLVGTKPSLRSELPPVTTKRDQNVSHLLFGSFCLSC